MKIEFYKYQGTGNDFVMIDNRAMQIKLNTHQINFLCNRKLGIGADGLILLEPSDQLDFKMVYYNADGNESSMCGNGGRCIAHFAHFLQLVTQDGCFEAIDGRHDFKIGKQDAISLKMNDVEVILRDQNGAYILNTGSPHYVKFVNNVNQVDIIQDARQIRNNETYIEKGINVNFVSSSDDTYSMRTYERGVEDETLSCGTGTVAAALSISKEFSIQDDQINLCTPGGNLSVTFNRKGDIFTNIWLIGPAKLVFKGAIEMG